MLLAAGCASTGGAGGGGAGGDPVVIGERMPELAFAGLSGKSRLRLSSLRGKVVLLDVWASWCEPCREELPFLDDLAVRLKPHGVEIIAVSVDQDVAAAEAFLRSRRRWHLTLAHDPEGDVADRLQPAVMPSSYIVDRAGILRVVNAGFERGDARRIESRLLEWARAGR